jgi:hypothetical protein
MSYGLPLPRPGLYLPFQVLECVQVLETTEPRENLIFIEYTLCALPIFGIIKIGVHFTSIPASMKWNEPRA